MEGEGEVQCLDKFGRDNLLISTELVSGAEVKFQGAFASSVEQWQRKWFAAGFWSWVQQPLSFTAAAHTSDSC